MCLNGAACLSWASASVHGAWLMQGDAQACQLVSFQQLDRWTGRVRKEGRQRAGDASTLEVRVVIGPVLGLGTCSCVLKDVFARVAAEKRWLGSETRWSGEASAAVTWAACALFTDFTSPASRTFSRNPSRTCWIPFACSPALFLELQHCFDESSNVGTQKARYKHHIGMLLDAVRFKCVMKLRHDKCSRHLHRG